MFIPTFGSEYGGVVINLIAFGISSFLISKTNRIGAFFTSYWFSFVFLSFCLLIIISAVFDLVEGVFTFTSVFSALRPFFIWTILTASYIYWDTRVSLIKSWTFFCDCVLIVLSLCALFEFLIPNLGLVFDLFYGERSSILTGPLGTSYYLGYIVFFIYLHYLFVLRQKFSIIVTIKFLMAAGLIYISDSKPPLVGFLVLLPLVIFPKKRFALWFFGYSLVCVTGCYILPLEKLVDFLVNLNIDSYNVSSFIRLLTDPEGAGTYTVRQEQIDSTLFITSHRLGLGVGMGRGILLESWISYYGYRYGIIGLVIYLFFWIFIAFRLFILGCCDNSIYAGLMICMAIWYLFQPILLLSGAMNESGISGVFSSITLGLSLVLIKRKGVLHDSSIK